MLRRISPLLALVLCSVPLWACSSKGGSSATVNAVPCALNGAFSVNFHGTDMGWIDVGLAQSGNSLEGGAAGVDTDEGKLTLVLKGTVTGSKFEGTYTSDYLSEPSNPDYVGAFYDMTCTADGFLGQWHSCDAQHASGSTCGAWQWGGAFEGKRKSGAAPDAGAADAASPTPDGAQTPAVNTAGCVAAVESLCVLAGTCAKDHPALTQPASNCPGTVQAQAAKVQTACENYLKQGLASNSATAVALNGADPTKIKTCMAGAQCTGTTATTVTGVLTSLASGSTDAAISAAAELVVTLCP